MSFNKKFFTTGGIVASSAECTTDTADIFGDGNGKALYSLDYDASDASGNYDGTPTDVTFGVGGQINYGARFNGSSSYIAVGSPIPNTDTNAAISAWVKLSSGISSTMNITGTGITSAGSEAPFRATLSYVSANTFKIFALRQVAGTYYYASTSSLTNVTINADTWYHVVLSYNSTGRKLSTFLNGTAIDTDVAMTTTGGSVNDSSTVIGSFRSTSGPFFDGDLDQIRFFTSTLTQANVTTLYAEEACVYTATTTDNDYPTTNVAYYKLDNSAEDEKGSYDGTETNIEYRFGRYGQAAVFNGSSSKIDTGLALNTSNAFSYSLWLNTNSYSTGAINMMIDTTSTTNPFPGCGIGHANGQIAGFIAGTTGHLTYNGGFLTLNQWHHTVLTHDGSGNFKLYVDGVETGTGSHSSNLNSGQNILIGNSAVSTWNGHNGKIDQVRIFSTALDSDQVSQLYNEKPETDTSNFKTVLYEGDGGSQYISNVGFEPDFVWIKSRDVASSHTLHDSVRGYDTDGTGSANSYKPLHSDATTAETAFTSTWHNNFGFLNSLDANGFTVVNGTGSTSDNYNKSNEDYVAWVWKGGGDASNIAVNSITGSTPSIASDVSANVDAGFSIVKYTGNDSATMTVAHGLDERPEIVITKKLDGTQTWAVYTNVVTQNGTTNWLRLDDTQAFGSGNFMDLSDTLLSANQIGGYWMQGSHIAYCWHSVSGYSKIGTYPGTSSTQTIVTGFKPSFVMIKTINTASNWVIFDDKRPNEYLMPSLPNAKNTLTDMVTGFVSNGFTLGADTSTAAVNSSAANYLYMAFK